MNQINPLLFFSHTKAEVTEFDLAVKRPWSRKAHHLHKFDRAGATNAGYEVSRSLANGFLRRFSKVFTIYRLDGHLSHVNWTSRINFCSPIP